MEKVQYGDKTYWSVQDIYKGLSFIETAKRIIELAKEKGVDLNEFRMKELNVKENGENSYEFIGGTPMSLVYRDFMTVVAQKTEKVEIPVEWTFTDTKGEIKKRYYYPVYAPHNDIKVSKTKIVDSVYNVYRMNIDVYNETVQHLKDFFNDFVLNN